MKKLIVFYWNFLYKQKIYLIGIFFGLQYGFFNILLNFFFFKLLYKFKYNYDKINILFILIFNIINIYILYYIFFIKSYFFIINILIIIIPYNLILIKKKNINIFFFIILWFYILPISILNKLIYLYINLFNFNIFNIYSIFIGYFFSYLLIYFFNINLNNIFIYNIYYNIILYNKYIYLYIYLYYIFGKIYIPNFFINNFNFFNKNFKNKNYNIKKIKNYLIYLFFNINKYNQFIKSLKNNNSEKFLKFEISQYFFFFLEKEKCRKNINIFSTFSPSIYIFYNIFNFKKLNNIYIYNFNLYKLKLYIKKYIYIYYKKKYIYIYKKRLYNYNNKNFLKKLYDPFLNKYYRKYIFKKKKKYINYIKKNIVKYNNKIIKNILNRNIKIYEIFKKFPKYSYKLINELEQQENEENILIYDWNIRSRKYKDFLIFLNKQNYYFNIKNNNIINKFYLINYFNQSDFDHDIIKGFIRIYRRKILIFKWFQFKTYSNIFFFKYKNIYNKKFKTIKLNFYNSIILINIIKSLILIIQSIFRKYIKIPIIIIIKNIYIYLFKKKITEWFNDYLKWKKEIHILCNFKKIPLLFDNNYNNYINYIIEGINIKVLYPYNYNNSNYFFFKLFGINNKKIIKKYNNKYIYIYKYFILNIKIYIYILKKIINYLKKKNKKNYYFLQQIYLLYKLLKLKNKKNIIIYNNIYIKKYFYLFNNKFLLKLKKNNNITKYYKFNNLNKILLYYNNIYQLKYNINFNKKLIKNIKIYNNLNNNLLYIKKNKINLEIILKKKYNNISELIKKGILLIDFIYIFNFYNKFFFINIIIKNFNKFNKKYNNFIFYLPEKILFFNFYKKIKLLYLLNIIIKKKKINTKKYNNKYIYYIWSNFTLEDLININKIYLKNNLLKLY
uniref:Hypothetical chloroplast RF19 n=1 Tax=Balanophora reflexa TaxID=533299 RepID=A0A3S5XHK3_9MAGN